MCVCERERRRRNRKSPVPPAPPLLVTKSDQGWPVSGVQASACPGRGMFPVPSPRSLIENVARIPGRAGHLSRLLSPREGMAGSAGLGSADCTPSRREPRPGVRLGIWLPQPSAACFFSSSPSSACQKSMMCSRDLDPHRSKLDSNPAADVSMPAARRQGAQRLLPPTRLRPDGTWPEACTTPAAEPQGREPSCGVGDGVCGWCGTPRQGRLRRRDDQDQVPR